MAFGFVHFIRKNAPRLLERLMVPIKAAPDPFPNVADIVSAQCSIWDSWKPYGGRKPQKNKREKGARAARFKATIEVWTAKEGKLHGSQAFVGTAHLLDGPELAAKVADLRKPTKTLRPFAKQFEGDDEGERFEAYGDLLIGIAGQLASNDSRTGPMFTVLKGHGTHFHLDTFVMATDSKLLSHDPGLTVIVQTPTGPFTFNGFESLTSSGKPLASNFILQSRISK